jgi:hypothetical protein
MSRLNELNFETETIHKLEKHINLFHKAISYYGTTSPMYLNYQQNHQY